MFGKLKLLWYILQILLLVRALVKQRALFTTGKGSLSKGVHLLFTLGILTRKAWVKVR
ncbi:MAG: hypothetical protein LUF04_14515 [Bacteroides sp.]|nr:hypothetical protein [Bacteroides sp.]MCD8081557.1 hypothetical protein [Bacteroides sp.]